MYRLLHIVLISYVSLLLSHRNVTFSRINARNRQLLENSISAERKHFYIPNTLVNDVPNVLGIGSKVAVFDTGIMKLHPHIVNRYERMDWTTDGILDDTIGHGTFVVGVISSNSTTCPGIAPLSTIYSFRIFTSNHELYTSWFLDAANYALLQNIDVINFSIGGYDYHDFPFIDKVNELVANGIIVVSAIGNDGPVWGTVSNPADQLSVLGVGGYDPLTHTLSAFSARGMTLWELPYGFGRVKPDILAPANSLLSSSHLPPFLDCRVLSGTSVACPIITGLISLILSEVKQMHSASSVHNAAAIKQILTDSAVTLDSHSIFEQGPGRVDAKSALQLARSFTPHVSLFPPRVSNRPQDCPYMWPWCTQSLFPGSQPLLANLTVHNSLAVVSFVARIYFLEDAGGESGATTPLVMEVAWNGGVQVARLQGQVLEAEVEVDPTVWPHSSYVGVAIRVHRDSTFLGPLECELYVEVVTGAGGGDGVGGGQPPQSPPQADMDNPLHSSADTSLLSLRQVSPTRSVVFFSLDIVKKPPRARRVLWDIFHSLTYPSGYVPNDDMRHHRQHGAER